jgi:hypothetical protein
MSKIKSITLRHFYLLYDYGTLSHVVKVSIASIIEPPNQPPLLSVILNYEDIFENDAKRMIAYITETSYAINLKPGMIPLFQPLRNLSATELEALR